jgi:hypothetical protein
MRRPLIAALLVGLAVPAPALAGWQVTSGNGKSYAKAGSIAAGGTPTATVSNRSITVSWSAVGGSVPVDGYVVERYGTGGVQQSVGAGCSGTVAALSCTESGVAPGAWRYSVTPVRQQWRGVESPQSTPVTVTAPSLSLSSSTATCLPDVLTGQIQAFIDGESVGFRLDDPSTGQALAGSISPAPVPGSGTANVSVTIPGGVTDGSHTVYAVGDQGDVAGAPLTLNTSGMRVASGSYAGNGSDNRNINGVGFQPDVVIIKGDTSGTNPGRVAVIRTSTMAPDRTKQLAGASGTFANSIQSFSASGFQVGSDARVNAAGPTYYWSALKSKAGHMAVGSYTGDGNASHPITGLDFSPEYAIVTATDIPSNQQSPVQRMSAMTRTFPFDTGGGSGIPGTGTTVGITSFDPGGFTVGNHASVNRNGSTYHYAAFNQCAGEMKTSSYTGNGAVSQQISGVGFQPDYTIIRANDTAIARNGVHRPASLGSSGSLLFNNAANIANGVTALQGDGFLVGNYAGTNAAGVSYPYIVFNDRP